MRIAIRAISALMLLGVAAGCENPEQMSAMAISNMIATQDVLDYAAIGEVQDVMTFKVRKAKAVLPNGKKVTIKVTPSLLRQLYGTSESLIVEVNTFNSLEEGDALPLNTQFYVPFRRRKQGGIK